MKFHPLSIYRKNDYFHHKKQLKMSISHRTKTVIGAIAGDVIGSVFEWNNIKTTEFPLFSTESSFTDDSILTMAVTDCILNNRSFKEGLHCYGRKYSDKVFGHIFRSWFESDDPQPYMSFGNGSAMRVSAVGFAYNSLSEVLEAAKQSAEITHNHIEGVIGAQSTASAIFLARTGSTKAEIKSFIETNFPYNLDISLDSIRPNYEHDYTAKGSIPFAIRAFLESTDYENAIRLAISIGGDSDTIACITGGIAAAFYKEIPDEIIEGVVQRLPQEFIDLLNQFEEKFN